MNQDTADLKPAAQDLTAAPAQTGEENQLAPHAPQDLCDYKNIPLPEGVSWAQDALDRFSALAEEIHLSPQQAEKLVQLEASYARETRDAQAKEHEAQMSAWAQQTRALFGPDYEREMARAVAAADTFGGEELRALLAQTGLGNHPVIVRTFNEIGKRISEDNTPLGDPSVSGDKTFAEALYGKHQ